MSDKGKRIFLGLSIIVPILLYCVYYYSIMIRNAPYKFSEFESLTFKYGLGDSLVNQYDSKTGNYHYLSDKDSLITKIVKLNKDDLLYLHRKAADLGFWNFPEDLSSAKSSKKNSPNYYLELNYERKSKKMHFDVNYNENQKLKDAARILIEEVSRTINDAEDRYKTK